MRIYGKTSCQALALSSAAHTMVAIGFLGLHPIHGMVNNITVEVIMGSNSLGWMSS